MPETPDRPQANWNPPAADEDFDTVFGGVYEPEVQPQATEAKVEPTPQPAEEPPQAVPAQPTLPAAPEWVLETETGTRYKSREEAAKGVAEKDRAIEEMRRLFVALHGVDPLTKKAPATNGNAQGNSYMANPTQYANDLTEAANSRDYTRYAQVQARFFDEIMQQRLGPYMPVVQNVGRREALDNTERKLPDFKTFYGSENYQKVLDSRPVLKHAVETAEADPNFQDKLPELYGMVYELNQAENLRTQRQQPQPAQPTAPIRTTLQPSTLTPQSDAGKPTAKPGLESSAGRKALIEELERKGVKDVVW